MEVFPNAKVLWTVRDPEKWYESGKNTIMRIRESIKGPTKAFLIMTGKYRMAKIINDSSNLTRVLNKGNLSRKSMLQDAYFYYKL